MAEQTVAGPKSSKGAPLKGAKKGNGAAKPRPKIFRRYSNAPPEPSPFPSFPALPSLESLVASPPLSFSHLCTLGLLLFILHKLTTMMSTLFRGAAVTTPSIIEHGTWMKVGKTSKSSTVMYTPLQNRVNEGGLLSTPPRRSSYSTSTTISASPGTGINPATAAASWVFFSPAKPPQPSKFIDYTDSPSKSVAALSGVNGIARDPYTSSKLMRKNLLSLIPLERQGGLHEALTRVYMTACDKEHTIAGREVRLRSDKSRLMMLTLFAAFEDEFSHGMPLPRSKNTAMIGLAQALKDSCRETIVVDGVEVKYSCPASERPEVAAKELTDGLGGAIEVAVGRLRKQALTKADLGRLTGRILAALCRTGSGGDTYCAVSALFDTAGVIGKSAPIRIEEEEVEEAAVFPFLIMPANSEGSIHPLRVAIKSEDGKAFAEIVTTSLLDVHLADEVMQAGTGGGKGGGGKGGMTKPLVRLAATIVECVSLDVKVSDRERSLRLRVE